MARPGPKRILRYGLEFKLMAVRLSQQPGIAVQAAAAALARDQLGSYAPLLGQHGHPRRLAA